MIGSRDAARAQATASELGRRREGRDRTPTPSAASTSSCSPSRPTRRSRRPRAVAAALGVDAAPLRCERPRLRTRVACAPTPTRARSPSGSRRLVDAPVAAGLHSIAAANLAEAPPEEDALVCGDDPAAKELALALAAKVVAGRALDAGPLASARTLEGLTAVIVNLNRRYKAHAGVAHHRHPGRVIEILPVVGLPEIERGRRPRRRSIAARGELRDGDVVVVAQKAVSKAEGRVVALATSSRRSRPASSPGPTTRPAPARGDPRGDGARRALPRRRSSSPRHVTASSAPRPASTTRTRAEPETRDPASARSRRERAPASARRYASRPGSRSAVDRHRLVRPPFPPGHDRRRDRRRRHRAAPRPARHALTATAPRCARRQIAVADEIAAAADLVRAGKADGIPVVIVRGARVEGDGLAVELVIPADRDLFR